MDAERAIARERRHWHLLSIGWPELTFTAQLDAGVQTGWLLRLSGEPKQFEGATILDCLEAANRLGGAKQPDG